jgi:hypothetical protein
MRRKLVGALVVLLGLMLWADAAPTATLAGAVVAVSGSCTAGGRVLKRGDAVQVSDIVDFSVGGKSQAADGRRVGDFGRAGQPHDRGKL